MVATTSETVAPPRRVLVAWSSDWGDVLRTLRFTLARVARPSDRITLAHVRVVDAHNGPAALPVVEVAVPVSQMLALWHSGDVGPTSKAVADACDKVQGAVAKLDAVELRTTLRVCDALLAYVRYVAPAEAPALLVMGSHGARNVGTALWKVPHTSLDVAAGLTACGLVLARPRQPEVWDAINHPVAMQSLPGKPLVVLALDGSTPRSGLQTEWALTHVIRPGDDICIVNRGDASDAALNAELGRCETMLSSPGTGVSSVRIVRLRPDADIRDWLVDMSETGPSAQAGPPIAIVIGTRGESASSLKRLVLGSTAEYVLRMAATTVVAIPPLVDLTPGSA